MSGTERLEPPSTDRVTALLDAYRRAYDTMHDAPDLSPKNPAAQRDLSLLVSAIRRPWSEEQVERILKHPDVKVLQYGMWGLMAKAERDSELYWNTRLERSHLKDFRLFKSFDHQVDAELACLGYPTTSIAMKGPESILMIGAGALPVSALLMFEKCRMPVTCIDANRTIAKLGRNFIERCGYSEHITYRYAYGEDYDLSLHPIVFMSNAVQNKIGILTNIAETMSVEELAVHSAHGVYALIYEPFSAQLAHIFNLKFNAYTVATPETLQTTLFAKMHQAPTHEIAPPQTYTADDLFRMPIPWGERHKKTLTPEG